MKVTEILEVMNPYKDVKIYNDYDVWCSGRIPVEEAKKIPNLDKLTVNAIWISTNGYLVIDAEVIE